MSTIDTISGGNIEPRGLEEEMRSAYLDYAMSVIVGRALPDARDGLKPVHRRVLFAMSEAGLQPGRSRAKSSRIVGDVLGKYHPHGDAPVYDTLVRLAQDFSMRYPLVDGQGNFGSIDDDPAAAMRYTEARLAPIAREMLRDLDQDTVDFVPNYDGKNQEPLVLPARFPNLLVNGSAGIAVGMATNIPPHNLRETIDAVIAYIDDPEIDVEGLMKHVKGPDFPTGGVILGSSGIRDAYATGRGRVRLQASAHVEPLAQGKEAIVVTELAYQVKKGGGGGLIQKIADLVHDKKISEISDIEDHSSDKGMRLVIELKRGSSTKVGLNKLYKHTPMQTTFGVNMVALVDNVPRTLSLRESIGHYVNHQREVITRRTKYELRRAEERAHVLEGLLIALANLDEVIALIRSSRDPDTARTALIEKFELTVIQAGAILQLTLGRLTALEADKIKEEHADLVERIKELREAERVQSVLATRDFNEGKYLVFATRKGQMKKTEFQASNTPIKADGIIAINIRDDDELIAVRRTSGNDTIIMVSRSGQAARFSEGKVRPMGRDTSGVRGMNVSQKGNSVLAMDVARDDQELLVVTENGYGKRTAISDYPVKGRGTMGVKTIALTENKGALASALVVREHQELVFISQNGMVQRTSVREINRYGRASQGVKVMNIRDDDQVSAVALVVESEAQTAAPVADDDEPDAPDSEA